MIYSGTSQICGIYKITNLVNGMCYIGQSRDIQKRWIDHRRKSPYLSNIYLHRAIRKYGIENFSFDVLVECELSELNELERKHIAEYNSLKPNGYNLDTGGGHGREITQETREKLRKVTSGSLNPNYGKPKSEHTRVLLALAHSPAVNQYSLDGKYIRTYETTVEASQDLGSDTYATRHNICACCRGERCASMGFQWRWAASGKGDVLPYIKTSSNRKPVSQFTEDGVLLNTFISAARAAKAVSRTSANILFACENRGTSAGYYWRLAT